MTITELRKIAISLLKDNWVETGDNQYYIKELKEADKEDLESVLSEIESNATKNADMVQDLIDELQSLL